MDLRQLEIFCKVIDLKSFSRAGDAVYLTQPTVSEHIKTLEEYLGTRLIDRMGKEVIPTNAGKILYGYGRKMLDLRIEAKQVIEDLSGKMAGKFTTPNFYSKPCLQPDFFDFFSDVLH